MSRITLSEAGQLVEAALSAAGATDHAAQCTARALVAAEADGLSSHGLSRVPQYATFLRNGRAVGKAVPRVAHERAASLLVDAGNGLAFPACALAIERGIEKAKMAGVAAAAVTNSHHFGVAAWHLEAVAEAGLIGIAMGNSPAAMNVPGGRQALLGTNPIACAFPRRAAAPLVMDMSLSAVARGKIMVAARDGKPIPEGWALDSAGRPTTDAKAALTGTMLPFGSADGGVKGGMLALMVELLVISLSGAHFGREADSFFVDAGNQPRLGQLFMLFDPAGFAGAEMYSDRVDALVKAMLEDDTVRLPGERRLRLREAAVADGIDVADALLTQIRALATR